MPHDGACDRWRNRWVPAVPLGLQRICQRPPAPVIPTQFLAASARPQPGPSVLRQRGQTWFDLPLPVVQPDLCLARHSQHIGMRLGFHPHAQAPDIAVDAVAGNPGGGHTAAKARASICWARRGLVVKRRAWGMPACRQRAHSSTLQAERVRTPLTHGHAGS